MKHFKKIFWILLVVLVVLTLAYLVFAKKYQGLVSSDQNTDQNLSEIELREGGFILTEDEEEILNWEAENMPQEQTGVPAVIEVSSDVRVERTAVDEAALLPELE